MARDAAQIIREARQQEANRPKQAQKQDGAEKLRETINRREYKPTPAHFRPDGGSYSGPMRTPGPPRFGDPNVGKQAMAEVRKGEQEARQARQQEQRQQR